MATAPCYMKTQGHTSEITYIMTIASPESSFSVQCKERSVDIEQCWSFGSADIVIVIFAVTVCV